MLKKILQVSSLTLMVAFAAGLPAIASEEDIAAPAGSFTSDMAIPQSQVGAQFAMHRHRAFWFARHAQNHDGRHPA
jgi:hypothetical protein